MGISSYVGCFCFKLKNRVDIAAPVTIPETGTNKWSNHFSTRVVHKQQVSSLQEILLIQKTILKDLFRKQRERQNILHFEIAVVDFGSNPITRISIGTKIPPPPTPPTLPNAAPKIPIKVFAIQILVPIHS